MEIDFCVIAIVKCGCYTGGIHQKWKKQFK